jgi:tetratricopeptide (TPR) repeat protein
MQQRRVVWALPLLLLALVPPSFAQGRRPSADSNAPMLSSGTGPTHSIRGTLRLASSEGPAELIRVDLVHSYNDIVETTFTHGNGDFEFGGIPAGNYYLVVELRGYEPVRESVQLDGNRWGVTLYLKEVQQSKPTVTGNSVSQRELTLPRKARNAYRKGLERLYQEKDPKGSITQFERAIAEFPGYYEAYQQLGLARMHLSQPDEAEQAFRKSIELSEGKYADPFFALGSMFNNKKKFAEAQPLLRRGLELDRHDWHGHYELAHALLGSNRLDDAEASAKQARTLRSDLPAVHLLLAEIHREQRDYATLLGDLDEYLKLEPTGPTSGRARELREQVQRALQGAQNVTSQNPRQP